MNDAKPAAQLRRPERHVVLVEPEIHWNTGNIGRTCLAADAYLHLIRPLGFSLESNKVKRAGLDYWEQVNLRVWESFDALTEELMLLDAEVVAARGYDLVARPLSPASESDALQRGLAEAIPTRAGPLPAGAGAVASGLERGAGLLAHLSQDQGHGAEAGEGRLQ